MVLFHVFQCLTPFLLELSNFKNRANKFRKASHLEAVLKENLIDTVFSSMQDTIKLFIK